MRWKRIFKVSHLFDSDHSEEDVLDEEIERSNRDAPPSHYTLKINSFSKLALIPHDRSYDSSNFKAGGHKWKLSLYPNGDAKRNGKGHISLYLTLADTKAITPGSHVDALIRFFVYDHIQDNYLTVQDGKIKRYHVLKTRHGFSQLLSLSTFHDSKNGYLIDDCCAFGVEVHVIKSTGKGEEFYLRKNPPNGTFSWEIENFSKLQNVCISKVFNAAGHKWKLYLYPRGRLQENNRSVSMVLELKEDAANYSRGMCVLFALVIKNQVSGFDKEKGGYHWFGIKHMACSVRRFMPLSDFHKAWNDFVVNDTLLVEAKIKKVSTVSRTKKNTSQAAVEDVTWLKLFSNHTFSLD